MSAYPKIEKTSQITNFINSNRTSLVKSCFAETERISTKIFHDGVPSPIASKIINYEHFESIENK